MAYRREMSKLEEIFSRLNPKAEEFVPRPAARNNGVNINALYFVNNTVNVVHRNPNMAHHDMNKNGKSESSRRMSHRTSMAQKAETIRRTVHVSDLDHKITEEQLAEMFESYGQVVDCRICGDPRSVLRFAFVEFTNEEGARAALKLSGTVLGFYPVTVLPSKTAIAPVNPTFLPQNEDEREMCAKTVYVTNIDKKVSEMDIKLFFEALCGRVYRLRVLGDEWHPTRIAFVEFTMAECATAALNCNGALLGSMPIRISPSKTPVRPPARGDLRH